MGKKIIIVGSGVSGLVAGIYTRLAGFDVEILESHAIVGGNCTGWERKGYSIDGCVQWLTGTKNGTGVNKIWRTCGALTDDAQVYNSDKIASTVYEGKMYHLYADVDKMKQEFLSIAPDDKTMIKKLVKYTKIFQNLNAPIDKPFEEMNIFHLLPLIWKVITSGKMDKKTQGMTMREFIGEFKSPVIRQLLACVFPIEMPVYTMFYNLGIRTSGDGGWPVGGSLEFVKRMQQRFEDLGGTVLLNTTVDKIIIKDGKAIGVKLEKEGREVFADYIISAVDADMLLNHLLESKYPDEFFETRFSETQNYMLLTGTYVSLGVTADLSDYPNNVYVKPEKPLRINNTEIDFFNVKIYNFDPKFMHDGKTVMTVLLTEDEYEFWKELKGRSKQEYTVEKLHIANWIKEGITSVFPELEGKFEMTDVATPLTFNRYCNSYRGTYMSFIPSGKVRKKVHKGKIQGVENLYLAGQTAFPAGGLPLAAISGKFAAQRIFKAEKMDVKL